MQVLTKEVVLSKKKTGREIKGDLRINTFFIEWNNPAVTEQEYTLLF